MSQQLLNRFCHEVDAIRFWQEKAGSGDLASHGNQLSGGIYPGYAKRRNGFGFFDGPPGIPGLARQMKEEGRG